LHHLREAVVRKTRVLIIDDSALMRQLLRTILEHDRELEVVGAVADPIAAKAAIATYDPDVLTLDVEMPKMDGITFLEQLMRDRPMPVVMVSSLTERGTDVTLRALELGAFDFVTKPKLDVARGTVSLGAEIVEKVKAAARSRPRPLVAQPKPLCAVPPSLRTPSLRTTNALVAIGASTGGTEALHVLLRALPPDSPPIVVVQHMPAVFTHHFAARLDAACAIRVREARDGDVALPGHVLIAPGGETHLEIVRSGAHYVVRLIAAPPLNHHRPSVDVLFRSCARHAGANAVGVILTGMGSDGADGLLSMRDAGARTLAQDEQSSVVFGMPKEAIACGAAESVVALDQMAAAIVRAAAEGARARAASRRPEKLA
jgi:two-component system, chemotaxis family, protein-glutamate methylesterase/glutaminase